MHPPAVARSPTSKRESLQRVFGDTVEVVDLADGALQVVASYSQARRALERWFGPTVRIEKHAQHGVAGRRVLAEKEGQPYVLLTQTGEADWAALLLGVLPVAASGWYAA